MYQIIFMVKSIYIYIQGIHEYNTASSLFSFPVYEILFSDLSPLFHVTHLKILMYLKGNEED